LEGMSGGPDFSRVDLEDILGDVFGQFFGNMGMGGIGNMGRRNARSGPQRGDDIQYDIEIPFDVACFGGEKTVKLRRDETCIKCDGNGIEPGMSHATCRQCNGSGAIIEVARTPLGAMQRHQVCPACGGNGIDPSSVCRTCGGKGTSSEVREVSIKVPAGCADGNNLRVRGEGDKGVKGGPSGDLYIAVRVLPSTEFSRMGFDIYTESKLDIIEAVLGTTLVVRTIDSETEVKVPAGTQPGTRLRIKGRGVPKLGKQGARGDHYITIKVVVPKNISSKKRSKFEELQQIDD